MWSRSWRHLVTTLFMECPQRKSPTDTMAKYLQIVCIKKESRVAHAQIFQILSILMWKYFYWIFDQIIKILLKNSKPFWRYKQYINWTFAKWNAHGVVIRLWVCLFKGTSYSKIISKYNDKKLNIRNLHARWSRT